MTTTKTPKPRKSRNAYQPCTYAGAGPLAAVPTVAEVLAGLNRIAE